MSATETDPTLADVTTDDATIDAAITVDGDIVARRVNGLSLPPWGTITAHRFDDPVTARAAELAAEATWNEQQLCAIDDTGTAVICTVADYATNRALSETGDLTSTLGGIGISAIVRSADGWWAFPTRSALCATGGGTIVATVGETAGIDDIRGDTWVGTRTLRRGLTEELALDWHDVDVTWTGANRGTDGGLDFTAIAAVRHGTRNELEARFAEAPDAWERDTIRWVHDNDLDELCADPTLTWAGWGAVAALDALNAATGRTSSGRLANTAHR